LRLLLAVCRYASGGDRVLLYFQGACARATRSRWFGLWIFVRLLLCGNRQALAGRLQREDSNEEVLQLRLPKSGMACALQPEASSVYGGDICSDEQDGVGMEWRDEQYGHACNVKVDERGVDFLQFVDCSYELTGGVVGAMAERAWRRRRFPTTSSSGVSSRAASALCAKWHARGSL